MSDEPPSDITAPIDPSEPIFSINGWVGALAWLAGWVAACWVISFFE